MLTGKQMLFSDNVSSTVGTDMYSENSKKMQIIRTESQIVIHPYFVTFLDHMGSPPLRGL